MYYEQEPFNPFVIGEPAKEIDYVVPSTPTYPPPVFATWPEPKQHTNKSVSQGTLAKVESTNGACRSYLGEVALSKAINEEMTISKKHVAKERHHDYDKSKTSLSLASDTNEVLKRSKSHCKEGSTAKRVIAGERGSYASVPANSDIVSRASLVSEGKVQSDKSSRSSRTSKICRITPSLKNMTDSIRRELAESAKLSRSLAAKASELSKRLKADYN